MTRKVVIDHDWDHPVDLIETEPLTGRRYSRSKYPLPYVVNYKGKTRRVYSTNYGFNSERVYLNVKGRELKVEDYGK